MISRLQKPLFFHQLAALVLVGLSPGITALAQDRDVDAGGNLLDRAVDALGGREAVESVRTLQLYGFGQEADGFGSGNVAASPYAPQKWGARNDLQRVWDLDNDRYMERQRGDLLFPFAHRGAHSFTLVRSYLDGDVSFRRGGGWGGGGDEPQRTGDADELKMQRLANPLVAVREAMKPGTTLSNVHVEAGSPMMDVATADGIEFTIGFDWATGRPDFVRWSGPNHLLGEVLYTARFTGYVPYGGVSLPLGIVIYMDWRDIEFFKIYGEGYIVNGDIPDLAAPASVLSAGPGVGGRDLDATEVADGIWRISSGTMVIEFADHLTLYELGGFGYDDETLPVIELARSLVPEKPLTGVIVSHQHDDHMSGLRTAVAEGLTVIAHRDIEGIVREIATRPAPNFPDLLHEQPQPLKFVGVDGHLRLADAERTLDIYHTVAHNHMANAVFAYDPNEKIMIEGDVGTYADDLLWWADAYQENLDHYGLEVDIIAPVHFDVMTHDELLEFIAPGRDRAQEWCVDWAEKGRYFVGCPPFFPRGDVSEILRDQFEPPFE